MRTLRLLLPWFLFSFAAGSPVIASAQALSLEEVVRKARAAVCPIESSLKAVKSLQFEITSVDGKSNSRSFNSLTLVAPNLRHEITKDVEKGASTVTCAGMLEAWTFRKLNESAPVQTRVVTYETFRLLRDMAYDDLAFFAIPEAHVGKAEYLGVSDVEGRQVHSVLYKYLGGFKITRHFDARTFKLIASDQFTPTQVQVRQIVDSFIDAEGISFVGKETIIVKGEKFGELIYKKVTINPQIPSTLFTYPTL